MKTLMKCVRDRRPVVVRLQQLYELLDIFRLFPVIRDVIVALCELSLRT